MRQCLLCLHQYEDEVQFCPHDGAALPPPDDFVGRMVDDKYRIDALHGTGGMGAVYSATQVALDRRVAIKVVKGDFLKDPIVTERFKREALAVARLKHPHIVTVYDFGFTPDGAAYLVMEFLEGRTLRQEIHSRGRVPASPAVELMRQICAAVSAAHAEGIIHRDLKPDNIFLEQGHDGALTVKILDTRRALDMVNLIGHMGVVGNRTSLSDLAFGDSHACEVLLDAGAPALIDVLHG